MIRLPTDAANLCDVILEQTLLGVGVNRLLLSYLKHSLHSHLVSYPAVIKRITQFTQYDKHFCIKALLDFLISIIDGVTCRSKAEESALMTACMSLVLWLIEMTDKYLTKSSDSSEQDQCLEKVSKLSRKIVQNQFLMGVLYLAKLEDREVYEKCLIGYKKIHSWNKFDMVKDFYQMIFVKFEHIPMKELEPRSVETISYCLQPFMSIEVLVNANAETNVHVSKFLMIQKLKKYSMPRLYCEIIRACFITLIHVREMNYRLWAGFYLYKVPLILKQLHLTTKNSEEQQDNSEDIVKAFDLLLESNPILDQLDTLFQCDTVEISLLELLKQKLINRENCEKIIEKRKSQSSNIEDFNIPCTPPPFQTFIQTIDSFLDALILTLSRPVSKEMSLILNQMLVDNRDFLLYTVAGVKGKHRTMANGLLKCNDSCKMISEASKDKEDLRIRAEIFDVSFIMLFSIIQKCGIDNFPELNGDYFFTKWAREAIIDPTKSKSPMTIVKMCDQSKVEEMITYFSDANNQAPTELKLGEICMNIPAMLYQIIIAWDTISPQVVKNILDNMRSKRRCFAVVAASWLCGYMNILLEDEKAKPRTMIQQLLKQLLTDEQIMKNDELVLRFNYSQEIIQKVYESQLSTNTNNKPLKELFNDQWKEVVNKQWLPFDVAIGLEQQFKSCSAFWLMKNLVDEMLKSKSVKEMEATSDIIFAIMHLNIESCTEALLRRILPIMFSNKNESAKLTEPQSRILAKLCVYAILSTIETTETTRKRQREDDEDLSPMAKMRKTGIDGSSSVEGGNSNDKDNGGQLKESLKTSLQDLFKIFHQQVCVDELSPNINFIYQFFSLIVQLEKSVKLKPILKLIPNGLIMNLLKIIPEEDLTYGFVLR